MCTGARCRRSARGVAAAAPVTPRALGRVTPRRAAGSAMPHKPAASRGMSAWFKWGIALGLLLAVFAVLDHFGPKVWLRWLLLS